MACGPEVQFVCFTQKAAFNFWPTIRADRTWNPAGLGEGNVNKWKIYEAFQKPVTVDVVGLGWFNEGVQFHVGCDVEGGTDVSGIGACILRRNGVTAYFTVSGGSLTGSCTLEKTEPGISVNISTPEPIEYCGGTIQPPGGQVWISSAAPRGDEL